VSGGRRGPHPAVVARQPPAACLGGGSRPTLAACPPGRPCGTTGADAHRKDEPRDDQHFFFDIGNGNLLAFFDFPGLDVGPYAEVLGGLHHMAISVEPARWQDLVGRLTAAGVAHEVHSGVSVYFRDPDGARIELIADPLGEMYGQQVL
jgi:hypothetical protein